MKINEIYLKCTEYFPPMEDWMLVASDEATLGSVIAKQDLNNKMYKPYFTF